MEDRLRNIMADILDVEPRAVQAGFGPADAANWDSMNNLRLVTAIEEEFNIRFSMDDIRRMTDFGQIVQTVGHYLAR
jgi:acyl carrier protein